MSNYKIYGFCETGCKREVVSKNEHRNSILGLIEAINNAGLYAWKRDTAINEVTVPNGDTISITLEKVEHIKIKGWVVKPTSSSGKLSQKCTFEGSLFVGGDVPGVYLNSNEIFNENTNAQLGIGNITKDVTTGKYSCDVRFEADEYDFKITDVYYLEPLHIEETSIVEEVLRGNY